MRPVGGVPATLARFGFGDPGRSASLLGPEGLNWWDPQAGAATDGSAELLADLAAAPDPDLAALALHRIAAAQDDPGELDTALREDAGLRRRLLGVLGSSSAIGDHLAANPAEWSELSSGSWEAEAPSTEVMRDRLLAGASGAQPVNGLRNAYRRALAAIATSALR